MTQQNETATDRTTCEKLTHSPTVINGTRQFHETSTSSFAKPLMQFHETSYASFVKETA